MVKEQEPPHPCDYCGKMPFESGKGDVLLDSLGQWLHTDCRREFLRRR